MGNLRRSVVGSSKKLFGNIILIYCTGKKAKNNFNVYVYSFTVAIKSWHWAIWFWALMWGSISYAQKTDKMKGTTVNSIKRK